MIGLFAALALPASIADPADAPRIRARSQPVLERFTRAVTACGIRPVFTPTIHVADRWGIIHYDPDRRRLVLYPWSLADTATRAENAARARAVGQRDDGREAYEEVFAELLVPHELGHWLQGFAPDPVDARGNYDGWTAEHDANRIMLAFWREHGGRGGAGERRIIRWLNSTPVRANPVPPPAGTAIPEFFNARRMTIVRGGAYGWYQSDMIRRALAERPRPRFCDLAWRWLPR